MSDFDVIVVGGGSAGTAAAAAAVDAGARTALVNDGELGGLCILRGCMPTKAMLASAHAAHEVHQLESLGLAFEGKVEPDFPRIMERKGRLVERFKRAKVSTIHEAGYELVDGRAEFADGGGVTVRGKRLRAKRYVIATGSIPEGSDIAGHESVPIWNSDHVMALEERPKRLLVQGAGAIGLELAQFFARIGTDVTLVNRSPLLSRVDPELGVELTRALEHEPRFELLVPGTIEKLEPVKSGLSATIRNEGAVRKVEADALLVALGRRPALDRLGLEKVGLELTGRGIAHDAEMRTENPEIYVAGDATGTFQILHLANQEGAIAGHNAADRGPARQMDYRLRMQTIFTDPPFAQVGLSERELERQERPYLTGRSRFPETGRAITMEARFGIWKLFADPETREILGSAILGPRADDLIHLISTLMYRRATVDEIHELPWYHPTLSEVILNVARDAVR